MFMLFGTQCGGIIRMFVLLMRVLAANSFVP